MLLVPIVKFPVTVLFITVEPFGMKKFDPFNVLLAMSVFMS